MMYGDVDDVDVASISSTTEDEIFIVGLVMHAGRSAPAAPDFIF